MANIKNQNEYTLVSGTSGNDTIYNGFRKNGVTINAGAGNDSIYNNQGDYLSISGGDGNDTIEIDAVIGESYGYYNYYGYRNTINGGKGNDRISLSGNSDDNLIEYTEGDGNDTVYGFGYYDTLKIGNGTTDTYSKETVGSDVVVTVGDGKITLSGAKSLSNVRIAGTTFIAGTEGNDSLSYTYNGYGDSVRVSINGFIGKSVIFPLCLSASSIKRSNSNIVISLSYASIR